MKNEQTSVAAVMPVKRIMDSDELTAFNDQVVQTESLGLTMNFADTVLIVRPRPAGYRYIPV